ncbi:MAG: sigma-70 family RNA polymerase sigma factor [Pseudomonadota bacterium]
MNQAASPAAAQDAALIERIAARDRLAIQALYGRYQVRLHRFITSLTRNEAIAEELTNETFMEIWRVAGNFEGRSAPSTWIFSIARFKTLSVLRKRSDAELDEDYAEGLEDDGDTPEESALKQDKAGLIRLCLEQLSAQHREVIDLVYYHEKSVKEVSEIAGVPENTVKTRMFHARKRLSELMQARGIDRGWP